MGTLSAHISKFAIVIDCAANRFPPPPPPCTSTSIMTCDDPQRPVGACTRKIMGSKKAVACDSPKHPQDGRSHHLGTGATAMPRLPSRCRHAPPPGARGPAPERERGAHHGGRAQRNVHFEKEKNTAGPGDRNKEQWGRGKAT